MNPSTTATEPVRTTQHFNRFELKYLVHYLQARELLERIAGHIRRDSNARSDGFYKVVSLYYDSPEFDCYWEKLDGEKFRRKVRVRTYADLPADAFVEIKQRLNLNVQKRRLRAPIEDVEEQMRLICEDRYEGGVHPVYDEVFYLRQRYRLRPTLVVSYNRAAFFGRFKKDLRITFDRNIRARNVDLSLRNHRTRGRFAIPPSFYILEVKFNEAIPRWLTTCLNALDLQVQRISKYCYGVECTGMRRAVGGA